MSVYKRGGVWWYKFLFAGQTIRESSKSSSRTVAKEAERSRRRQLEESYNRIHRRKLPPLFSVAGAEWLKTLSSIAPKTEISYRGALRHLGAVFGRKLLCDIDADDVAAYQTNRKRAGVSPRTANIEVGVLRSLLRKHHLWEDLSQDVKFLKESETPGRALSSEEVTRLLDAAAKSRCRGLYPALVVALSTGLRTSEIRLLLWRQVDLVAKTLTVGKSKTAAGTGRVVPLNQHAVAAVTHWRAQFPEAKPEHYVFPSEKYGLAGNERRICAYKFDPTRPVGSWKTAWKNALRSAGFHCRFHDLRHTVCTRMLEAGVPFSVVAELMGWSASTTALMVKRYGHIGQSAQRQAVEALDLSLGGHKIGHSPPPSRVEERTN